MVLRLSPSTAASLRQRIDALTGGPQPESPGVILHIVDSHNATLFSHASHPHTPTTLFSVYSVTKIICTLAFLQLVDLGAVSLDDPSVIERMLPELAAKKVLTGSVVLQEKGEERTAWTFEERKSSITPRMLLNHTSGTGHSLFDVQLRAFLGTSCDQVNETNDPYGVILQSPLLCQPGTRANYGQGFDWMGVLIERLTKRALSDVFRENIFEQVGLRRSGYTAHLGGSIATAEGVDYWPVSSKGEVGFVALEATPQPRVEKAGMWPGGGCHVQTGAIGVVSCVADLARMLCILLRQNAGVDPASGRRILSAESAAEVAKAQLTGPLREGWGRISSTDLSLANAVDVQGAHLDPEGSFGLGCAVQGADRELGAGRKGRSKGTMYWFGAASTEFWVDVEKGMVVVVTGNFFPFGDRHWTDFVASVEGLIYEGLEEHP